MPQQSDESSCGLMMIRNTARQMNDFSVGGWHDVLDDGCLRMDMVASLQACILDNIMKQRQDLENPRESSSEGLENELEELDLSLQKWLKVQ